MVHKTTFEDMSDLIVESTYTDFMALCHAIAIIQDPVMLTWKDNNFTLITYMKHETLRFRVAHSNNADHLKMLVQGII